MDVTLIKDMPDVGRKGDILDVSQETAAKLAREGYIASPNSPTPKTEPKPISQPQDTEK